MTAQPQGREGRVRTLLLVACPVLAFVLLHQAFVARAHPDALYMDSLRVLYQLQEWQAGRLSFTELWGLGSAHRGFINQLALMLNVRFFSLDVMLANRLTGVMVGAQAFVLAYVFNRQEVFLVQRTPGKHISVLRFFVTVLMVGLCFSWASFELFTLDLGLPLWTKNLCFVLFFAAHGRYLASEIRSMHATVLAAVTLSLAGVLIVMFIGMGWSYAFVGAVLAVQVLAAAVNLRAGRWTHALWRCVPLAVMLAALVWSLVLGAGGGLGGDGDSMSKLVAMLPTMVGLALHALGAAWAGVETFAAHGAPLSLAFWLGIAGVLAAAHGVIDRLRRGLHSGALLPIYLIAYGLLTALSLAAARGEGGAQAVMASRYYMDVAPFLIGTLWLWAEAIATRGAISSVRASAVLFSAFALSVGLGLGLTYRKEWQTAPYRAQVFQAMNLALRRGVPDEEAARLLQSPMEHARRGAGVMREQRLAVFADEPQPAPPAVCDERGIGRSGEWNAEEPGGTWMGGAASLAVPACACDLVASLYLPDSFSARRLDIEGAGEHHEVALHPGESRRIVLPTSVDRSEVRLSVSEVTVPKEEIAGSSDVRRLGVLWTGLSFECAAPEMAQ